MQQIVNKAYAGIFTTNKRYTILGGGRGAGRSTVASQYILAKLIAPEYFRCAIMRFILSDIRNSSFREICDRAEEQGILGTLDVNEGQMTISYGANSINAHAFRKSSGDQKAKLKSLANYNQVWVEEADEVPEADFMQLDDSLRTVKSKINIMLTFNPPPKTHWINKRWFNLLPSGVQNFYLPECKDDDVLFIRTDWRDNDKNIDEGTKKRYEQYRQTKPEHYWNMIRGFVPETIKGKIYSDWQEIEELPHEAKLLGHALDFGFDPDPSAGLSIYYYNGGYILDEVVYQTQLDNEQLANVFKNRKKAPIVADSAEPKSIAEMNKFGVEVYPCVKGADSVRFGIKHVQSLRVSYTRRSVNIKAEYDNYAWKISKDGEDVGIEDPKCMNHLMSAARYGLSYFVHEVDEDAERADRLLSRLRLSKEQTV
jgi:phage terminase large subunit